MNARHISNIAVTPSVFLYKLSSHTHTHHCRSPFQLVAVSGQKSVDGGWELCGGEM